MLFWLVIIAPDWMRKRLTRLRNFSLFPVKRDNWNSLKCIWHEKYFLLIWKAFQNTEEWRLSFWIIFFRFRDMEVHLLCKLDQWWCHTVCNWKVAKYWINDIFEKYWSSVLETWHHKCASQKKQNVTLNAVAMTTVWPLVLS